jgi:hypothetical protein
MAPEVPPRRRMFRVAAIRLTWRDCSLRRSDTSAQTRSRNTTGRITYWPVGRAIRYFARDDCRRSYREANSRLKSHRTGLRHLWRFEPVFHSRAAVSRGDREMLVPWCYFCMMASHSLDEEGARAAPPFVYLGGSACVHHEKRPATTGRPEQAARSARSRS